MRAAAALLALIATSCNQAAPPTPSQSIVPQIGRWTIIHSPQIESDTMLLDTTTGDTWQLVKLEKDVSMGLGWQFIGKIDQASPEVRNSN